MERRFAESYSSVQMKELYKEFEENLERYATQYKNDINKDPNFRDNFN